METHLRGRIRPVRLRFELRPYFISYRRQPWGPEVLRLSAAFRRRGIRTIVDVSDQERIAGQAQYDELRRIIQEDCDGFTLYMTRNVPDSACVWNVEVPAALEAFDRGGYDFLPLFRDIAPSDAAELVPHGRRISALGGSVIEIKNGETGVDQSQISAANAILRAGVQRLALPKGEPLVLGIRTREAGVYAADADLMLDWSKDYESLLAGDEGSAVALGAALSDVCSALGAADARTVRVAAPGHLSAGLAFGYTFHRASGFQLEVAQEGVWWPASGDRASPEVRIAAQQLDPGARDIVLALALSRPEVVGDADAAIGTHGLHVGGRITIEPEGLAGREAIRSEAQARGIIAAVIAALMKARAAWGTRGTTHIFMACPFAFATLLGHGLNAFGPLALYEMAPGLGYVRVLTLS